MTQKYGMNFVLRFGNFSYYKSHSRRSHATHSRVRIGVHGPITPNALQTVAEEKQHEPAHV